MALMDLSWDRKDLFQRIVPSICIPIAIVNLLYNSFLLVVYSRSWRLPVAGAFLNTLTLDLVSSVCCISIYSVKLFIYKERMTEALARFENAAVYTELFTVYAAEFSTILLVSLRLLALLRPFLYRTTVSSTRVFCMVAMCWVLAVAMVILDHRYYFTTFFAESEWGLFLVVVTLSFLLALCSLCGLVNPLVPNEYRKATQSIVALAMVNFLCYGVFGAFFLTQPIVCGSGKSPIWVLQVFCNVETFNSLIFIFPTLNSLANAVVLSRSSHVKEEARKLAGRIRGILGFGCVVDQVFTEQQTLSISTG